MRAGDIIAQMLDLTRGLLKRGYPDDAAVKILGGDWLRVSRETW